MFAPLQLNQANFNRFAAGAGVVTVVTFGAKGDGVTDDTAAFQAAAATGKTVIVPVPSVSYLITDGNIAVSSNTAFIGLGSQAAKIQLGPTTLNSLFNVGTSTHIAFRNLYLIGNQATQQSVSSGSVGIAGSPGCTDIIVDGCLIEDWTRHGINLDGVTRATINNNFVQRCYHGAGILTGSTTLSTDVKVTNNTVKSTHQGNIQAFFGVDGWVVVGNYCDTTAWGSVDMTDIADNITSYQPTSVGGKNFTIADNICLNSGNNGMHIGVSSAIISNNVIVNPANAGLAIWRASNTAPDRTTNVIVSGNDISYTDNTNVQHLAVSIRNLDGFTVTGNIIKNAYKAFEIRSVDPPTGATVGNGSIVSNVTVNTRLYSVELNSTTTTITGVVIDSNSFGGDIANASSEDIRFNTTNTPDDILIGANNYSSGSTIALRKLQATGSASGGTLPAIKATGSAADISIALTPKGAGLLFTGANFHTTGYLFANSGITAAAGSALQAFVRASTVTTLGLYFGTGDPTFSAGKGSLYTKIDATSAVTRLWVNTNGSTTWAFFTASA